uniref:hypothetical protein n=1 Tax=Pseudomonas sp. EA_35y_Pfl1_P108 TaxID=3088688 RepID=UPI0030DDCD19
MRGLLMVVCLYDAVEYCLRGQSDKSLDDASLMPFADDPEVAPQEAKPGWSTRTCETAPVISRTTAYDYAGVNA